MTFLLALTKTTTLLVDLFANSPDVLELIDGETLVDGLFEMNKVWLVNTLAGVLSERDIKNLSMWENIVYASSATEHRVHMDTGQSKGWKSGRPTIVSD